MAFTPKASLDISVKDVVDEDQIAALVDNDEALVEQPFALDFTEKSQTGVAHPTFGSAVVSDRQYVPAAAKKLRVTVPLKASAGTGYVSGTVGGVSADAAATTTSSTYEEVTLTWSDVSSLRQTFADLDLKLSNTGSGNTTYVESVDRGTCRWYFV